MEYIAKRTTHISIHAPRTGSDPAGCWRRGRGRISIHAPRTGSDGDFSSGNKNLEISIHAPRTGSDSSGTSGSGNQYHFNPRSPHGERRDPSYPVLVALEFQSTLPARGATTKEIEKKLLKTISIHAPRTGSDGNALQFLNLLFEISIHAPRTGSDVSESPSPNGREYFNPRSPHGERPGLHSRELRARHISIHAPRTGSDGIPQELRSIQSISIHAPRTGSDGSKWCAFG